MRGRGFGPVTADGGRQLGLAARLLVLALDVVGVVIGASSGFGLLWFVPFAGVGTLLVFRRPGTSIGWLLLGLAWAHVLSAAQLDATAAQFTDGSLSVPVRVAAWMLGNSGSALFTLYPALMLIFPSGRLPGGRWGTLGRVGLAAAAGLDIVGAFGPKINVNLPGYANGALVPNPFAVAPDWPAWQVLSTQNSFLPLIGFLVAAAVSLVVRFRHATGIERQQLRWMGAAVIAVVLAVVGGLVVAGLAPDLGDSGVVWIPAIFAFTTVPVAIGIAVLRYRLYEIDRVVSRTISWALTTALVGGLFAALIVALQALLAPVTDQNSLAVAGSTLAAAALFQPIRRRVQSAVDHRFNRSRYDAERIVATFATDLRGETDLTQLDQDIIATVTRSLHPRDSGIWLRGSER